jgi:hypothetical protein
VRSTSARKRRVSLLCWYQHDSLGCGLPLPVRHGSKGLSRRFRHVTLVGSFVRPAVVVRLPPVVLACAFPPVVEFANCAHDFSSLSPHPSVYQFIGINAFFASARASQRIGPLGSPFTFPVALVRSCERTLVLFHPCRTPASLRSAPPADHH